MVHSSETATHTSALLPEPSEQPSGQSPHHQPQHHKAEGEVSPFHHWSLYVALSFSCTLPFLEELVSLPLLPQKDCSSWWQYFIRVMHTINAKLFPYLKIKREKKGRFWSSVSCWIFGNKLIFSLFYFSRTMPFSAFYIVPSKCALRLLASIISFSKVSSGKIICNGIVLIRGKVVGETAKQNERKSPTPFKLGGKMFLESYVLRIHS